MNSEAKITISFKVWFGYVLAALAVGILGTMFYMRPERIVEGPGTVVETENRKDTNHPAMGWIDDQELISDYNRQSVPVMFGDTPAGKAVMGAEEDRFLWRAVRKAGAYADNAYPNINQQSVGCCVGCGWKHGCDMAHGINISRGNRATFIPVSAEIIYAGSRVEVGGGKMRGDGSVGAWARDFVTKWGLVAMQKYPDLDLSTFIPDRARQLGSKGVPPALETIAKQFPVKDAALVKSADEGIKAILQDYPIPICSNVGFNNRDNTTGTRDKNGFIAARGQWNHCMVVGAYRKAAGSIPAGVFILNSWGDDAHKGGVYPPDMPVAGFWIDIPTFDRILKQNDSYAISAVTGFPARKPTRDDWFAETKPLRDDYANRKAIMGPLSKSEEFALAP